MQFEVILDEYIWVTDIQNILKFRPDVQNQHFGFRKLFLEIIRPTIGPKGKKCNKTRKYSEIGRFNAEGDAFFGLFRHEIFWFVRMRGRRFDKQYFGWWGIAYSRTEKTKKKHANYSTVLKTGSKGAAAFVKGYNLN